MFSSSPFGAPPNEKTLNCEISRLLVGLALLKLKFTYPYLSYDFIKHYYTFSIGTTGIQVKGTLTKISSFKVDKNPILSLINLIS